MNECPQCGGSIPNDKQPGAYPGAISRMDNKTEICSKCGMREAMEDFAKFLLPVEKSQETK